MEGKGHWQCSRHPSDEQMIGGVVERTCDMLPMFRFQWLGVYWRRRMDCAYIEPKYTYK